MSKDYIKLFIPQMWIQKVTSYEFCIAVVFVNRCSHVSKLLSQPVNEHTCPSEGVDTPEGYCVVKINLFTYFYLLLTCTVTILLCFQFRNTFGRVVSTAVSPSPCPSLRIILLSPPHHTNSRSKLIPSLSLFSLNHWSLIIGIYVRTHARTCCVYVTEEV